MGDPCSLYAQSKIDPRRPQGDGWGLGFYINGSLKTVKSVKPIFEEYERFRSIVNNISSTVIIAHVRRASNPRGLPKEKLLSIENSQPFSYKNYVFAHNGVINLPDEMADLLGDWQLNIKGLNDSEVYFWYIMKEISEGGSIPRALRNFQRDLVRVWSENRDKYPDKDRPFIGLNIVFSDGKKLYAYCKYDEERDRQAASLCYGDQPAMQMSYVYSHEKLVVLSEKTNLEENWRPLMNGHLIIGQVVNEKVRVNLQKI